MDAISNEKYGQSNPQSAPIIKREHFVDIGEYL